MKADFPISMVRVWEAVVLTSFLVLIREMHCRGDRALLTPYKCCILEEILLNKLITWVSASAQTARQQDLT